MNLLNSEGALQVFKPFKSKYVTKLACALKDGFSQRQLHTYISLGMLQPNSRDRQGKVWLPKKQIMTQETTLQ